MSIRGCIRRSEVILGGDGLARAPVTSQLEEEGRVPGEFILNQVSDDRDAHGGNLHLVHLECSLSDGNFRSPSGILALCLQRLCDLLEDYLIILRLGRKLHLAMRLNSAIHGPANIGEVCRIHVNNPPQWGSRSSPRKPSVGVSIRRRRCQALHYAIEEIVSQSRRALFQQMFVGARDMWDETGGGALGRHERERETGKTMQMSLVAGWSRLRRLSWLRRGLCCKTR